MRAVHGFLFQPDTTPWNAGIFGFKPLPILRETGIPCRFPCYIVGGFLSPHKKKEIGKSDREHRRASTVPQTLHA